MRYYITFRSVTFAQRGERMLRQSGVGCSLQRTPKWMEERGCGYCLRVRPADAMTAAQHLREAGLHYSRAYAVREDGSIEDRQL